MVSDTYQDEDEATETRPRRRWRRVVWWSVSCLVLVAAVLGVVKIVADSKTPQSELDIWNKSSPAATAPLTKETATVAPKDNVIGTNSNLTEMDVMDIMSGFYQHGNFIKFRDALVDIPQGDLDTLRLVIAGQESAAMLDKILQKHGLAEATAWSSPN